MLGIVGKQARVELRKTARAGRAGALGREHGFGDIALAGHQAVERRNHVCDAFAVLQRQLQAVAQHLFVGSADMQVRDRQLNGVFLEAVDAWEFLRRQEFAVDAQIREALVIGPLREIGIDAFAIHHQRRHEADMLAFVVAHDACRDRIRALRFDRHPAIGTMLRAKFYEKQAQEVMDFGQRTDRALAAATAGALLDCDGRRDAVDRVHIRA